MKMIAKDAFLKEQMCFAANISFSCCNTYYSPLFSPSESYEKKLITVDASKKLSNLSIFFYRLLSEQQQINKTVAVF